LCGTPTLSYDADELKVSLKQKALSTSYDATFPILSFKRIKISRDCNDPLLLAGNCGETAHCQVAYAFERMAMHTALKCVTEIGTGRYAWAPTFLNLRKTIYRLFWFRKMSRHRAGFIQEAARGLES
jgi:hypothetical protein